MSTLGLDLRRDPLRWLRNGSGAVAQLVCFPHAGGAASWYHGWAKYLPPTLHLAAVQYPGREDRLAVEHPERLLDLATEVVHALEVSTSLPVVLFGHSMGASIAHETAALLEQRGTIDVAALLVSARQPPAHHRPGNVHLASDEVLWAEMGRLDGTAADVLANPQIRDLVLPTIRADYRMVETYEPSTATPLRAPVVPFAGADDTEVEVAEMADWAGESLHERIEPVVFPGGHFYIDDQLGDVVQRIVRTLASGNMVRNIWPAMP